MKKLVVALSLALVASLAGLGYELAQTRLPKYKPGQCLARKVAPEAYIIQKLEDGQYKGVHVLLMFGLPLDAPFAALNLDKNLVEVNCDTGEPVQ